MLAQNDILTKVFSILNLDGVLVGLVKGGFHDGEVHQNITIVWPYVVIDSWIESKDNRLSTIGRDATFNIHIHSNVPGSKQLGEIGARIDFLLNLRQHGVSGSWNITHFELDQTIALTKQDHYRQLTMRYRVKCQPLPSLPSE